MGECEEYIFGRRKWDRSKVQTLAKLLQLIFGASTARTTREISCTLARRCLYLGFQVDGELSYGGVNRSHYTGVLRTQSWSSPVTFPSFAISPSLSVPLCPPLCPSLSLCPSLPSLPSLPLSPSLSPSLPLSLFPSLSSLSLSHAMFLWLIPLTDKISQWRFPRRDASLRCPDTHTRQKFKHRMG